MRDFALSAPTRILYAERVLHSSELQLALATERVCETRDAIDVCPLEPALEVCENLIVVESNVVQEFFASGRRAPLQGYLQQQLSHTSAVHADLSLAKPRQYDRDLPHS